MPTRTIKRHDTADFPRFRALDAENNPINLTGSTITYTLFLPDGTLKINRGAAEVADQSVYLGEGYYPWEIVDVDTAVKYREEWEVVYPDGRKSTFPKKAKWYVVMEPDADNV